MQFKYPELLWALVLLAIPIIIHLFQLRRFTVTPFTNLKFLQKVVAKSRKSNRLKKLLLLLTRLTLLSALIFAFAQPYFASSSALQEKETVIYLDDSFSMQARNSGQTILSSAIQELIRVIPPEDTFSLFTNTQSFKDVTLKQIQNQLLALSFTDKQLGLQEIQFKANTLFSTAPGTIKNFIVLSDFQEKMGTRALDSLGNLNQYFVQLSPDEILNSSIDTLFISAVKPEIVDVTAQLSSSLTDESIPVSLYNGNQLIAKTAAIFDATGSASVHFSLSKSKPIKGRIEISDIGLAYDNLFYFNIDERPKIKVLAIGEADSDYLNRIYTPDEFELTTSPVNALNYSDIPQQNLIVLNEVATIPQALQNALQAFKVNGGSIVIVPSKNADLNNYNQLLSKITAAQFRAEKLQEQRVNSISYTHPFFENIFEKRVTNFEAPTVTNAYGLQHTGASLLNFGDGSSFLIVEDNCYIFSASIDRQNSNFKTWKLIVPIFYTIGTKSLKLPQLYEAYGSNTELDVATKITNDAILEVSKDAYSFIPQQQVFTNRVRLRFSENPNRDGIYAVTHERDTLQHISFNYTRSESEMVYLNSNTLSGGRVRNSITSLFNDLENDNTIHMFWKWFVILALVLLMVEVLIQKYF